MNNRIRQILDQISTLEDELSAAIEDHRANLRYRLEGKRVVFEQAMSEAHQRVRLGVLRWLLTVRPQNFITMPVIYGMAVPLVLFDLIISFYQLT